MNILHKAPAVGIKSYREGADDVFNFLAHINDAFQLAFNIVSSIQWLEELITGKSDKLLEQLKDNTEYMKAIYSRVDNINNKLGTISNISELTQENLLIIKATQEIQIIVMDNINTQLSELQTKISQGFKIVKQGIDSLAAESLQIHQGIENILLFLIDINEQLKDIRNEAELNSLDIQLSEPYQKLTFAYDRFNLLSKGVFDDTNKNNDIPESLSEFVTIMAGYSTDGLIYNINYMLDELKGNNFTGTKASSLIVGNCIHRLEKMSAPNNISPLSWIISQYSTILSIVTKSVAVAGMSYSILQKNLSPSLIDELTDNMATERDNFVQVLNVFLKSRQINDPGLMSSLHTDEWEQFKLDSGIDSKTGTFTLKADDGQAIVGFEFILEDNHRVIARAYQAKTLPYYCIDVSTADAVTTKSVELTGLIMGTNSFPHASLCNNETLNPIYGINKHRRFNDGYVITQIDFTGVNGDGKQVLFNYQVSASAYNAETGSLSSTKVLANDSNSIDVTGRVRKLSDKFYEKTQKTPGLPITRLLDIQLSPLNGFYLFIQGTDLLTDAMVIMTNVTLDHQITNYINESSTKIVKREKSPPTTMLS